MSDFALTLVNTLLTDVDLLCFCQGLLQVQYGERMSGEETRGTCFGRSDDVGCDVRGGAPSLHSDSVAGEHFRRRGFGFSVNIVGWWN